MYVCMYVSIAFEVLLLLYVKTKVRLVQDLQQNDAADEEIDNVRRRLNQGGLEGLRHRRRHQQENEENIEDVQHDEMDNDQDDHVDDEDVDDEHAPRLNMRID